MSQRMLYQLLGIRGYQYVRLEQRDGETLIVIEQPRDALRCPVCGTAEVFARGSQWREFRHVPMGSRRVRVGLFVPRVSCRRCGLVRQVRVPFAAPRRSYTRAFERHALELLKFATIQDVSRHLGISWDVVKEIQKRHLQAHFGRPALKSVRRIAIDEIYSGRKHKYLTIVLDLDSGRVVFVGHGKGADALEPFWKRLHAAGAQVAAVALDMSPAFAFAVRKHLPEAVLVNDRFHIIKLYNECLTELRRELHREAQTKLHKDVLKGTRWLLLKRSEHLDKSRREPQRLQAALKLNESLATAYYLKDDLNWLWECDTKTTTRQFLDWWIEDAHASGIRVLQRFAKTLQAHRSGILSWYDHPISTGPLEGTNNKIKTMQRQAYGFRDLEFFKLKIYALHRSKYALVG